MRTPSSQKCRLDLAPPLADRFILGFPIDYGPVVLLMPFGFHLTMDTLPSEEQLHSPASEALPPLLDIALLIRVPEGLQPSRTTRCSAHTTPAADCCHRVKNDFSLLRLEFETGSRSPEVSSTAFNAQPLDLHSVPLIDMGFAIIG